ncbi:hypothetical protein INT43_000973 [Umbelopsis isabellina]|uniref:Aquaporin n=1 Tax=Mortierella isabellina TaxID=91625 RepID=A0A8H7UJ53_MORIS|nr:hypothetical protein INT43_000973 [Umbelopsis isabellina]
MPRFGAAGQVVPTGIVPIGIISKANPTALTNPNFPLRGDVIAFLGELVGMTIFIFLALAGVQITLISPAGSGNLVPTLMGPSYDQIQSIAFCFGTAITVALFFCAPISGGCLNPAVVVALLMTGNLPFFRAFLLLIAELVGAILGSYFANWVTSGVLLGVNAVAPGYNNAQATFAEALLTCCLCLTVLFIIIEKNTLVTFAPFVVGTVVFMCHLIGTHIDGTSINPARSFGAAVVTGKWTSQHWVFWVGPITGALFSVIIYVMFKSLRYEVQSDFERDQLTSTVEGGMKDEKDKPDNSNVNMAPPPPAPGVNNEMNDVVVQ